ncbi:MAG: molecular chaperone DnaK, partial [Christensenellales bacterium]
TGTDTESIKQATKELTDVFGKLYEAAQAAQGAQGAQGFDPNAAAGGSANGAGGQDYYDADYTVVDDDDKK